MVKLYLYRYDKLMTHTKEFEGLHQADELRMWAHNRDLSMWGIQAIENGAAGWFETPIYSDDLEDIIDVWRKVQGVADGENNATSGDKRGSKLTLV